MKLFIVACLNITFTQTGCRRDRSGTGVAPAASSAASIARQIRQPDCGRIHACLASLPHDYVPSTDQELRAGVARCLGATPAEQWNARGCLPFEFGRDPRNGRGIEAYVTAGELMPYDVKSVVRYVDVSEIECICLRGAPLRSWGFDATYVGCGPSGAGDEPDDRKSFVVTTHQVDGKSGYEVTVSAGVPSYRLSFLGFPGKVDRINGAAVRSASQIDAMIVDLLTSRVRTTRSWQAGSTEFHYISRDTLDHLTRDVSDLRVLELRGKDWIHTQAAATAVSVNGKMFSCDAQEAADETSRCLRFSEAVEGAAKTDRGAPNAPARFDCDELRELPTSFAARRHGINFELRYVDWMPRPRSDADDLGAQP